MAIPSTVVLAFFLFAGARLGTAADPVATCEKKKLAAAARVTAGMLRCAASAA
jgi:hypothetical protein